MNKKCEGCDGSGVRIDSPAHSGLRVPRGFTPVEMCDTCNRFLTDAEAAKTVSDEFHERFRKNSIGLWQADVIMRKRTA